MRAILVVTALLTLPAETLAAQVAMPYIQLDLTLAALKDAYNADSTSSSAKAKLRAAIDALAAIAFAHTSTLGADQMTIRVLNKAHQVGAAQAIIDSRVAGMAENMTIDIGTFTAAELASMPAEDAAIIAAATH